MDMLKSTLSDIEKSAPPSYSAAEAQKFANNRDRVFMEYNGIRNFVDQHARIKEKFLAPKKPSDDPTRWEPVFREVEQELAQIRELESGSFKFDKRSQKGIDDMINKKRKFKADEFVRMLDRLGADARKAQHKANEHVETFMLGDFKKRLDWLIDSYKTNPPKIVADPKKTVRELQEMKKILIREIPNLMQFDGDQEWDAERLAEIKGFSEAIGSLESDFAEKNAFMDGIKNEDGEVVKEGNAISTEDLKAKFTEVEQVKRESVDARAAEAAAQIDEIIGTLTYLQGKVDEMSLEPHQAAKERKELQQTIDNLLTHKNAPQIWDDALYCTASKKNPEGNAIKWEFSGDEVDAPDGLKGQIALLDQPGLMNEQEKASFAASLNEALQRCEEDMKAEAKFTEVKLGLIKERVDSQRTLIDGPKGKGKHWNWSFVAVHDVMRAGEIIKDWSKTRHDRNSSARIGALGVAGLDMLKKIHLFDLDTLPNEFDRKIEDSEQETVNKYKEIYKNKDAWQIEVVAYETGNADELKACMYLLSEKGRLRWDRMKLLKQFNKFQKSVQFGDDLKAEMSDIGTFYEKLKQAVGTMWDYDTFTEMKNSNMTSYESEKEKHKSDCDAWAETASADGKDGLSAMAESLLSQHVKAVLAGEQSKADPTVYEKIIHYAMDFGKMGSEEKLYYLIQGIAWGLLAPDRGSVLNSGKINDYPVIDYFGSPTERGEKPTLEDIIEVAAYDGPPRSFGPGPMFMEWFHSKAMTLERVTQRLDKTLTGGNKLDHDDLTAFLGYMEEQTAETLLRSTTNGFLLPQTGVQNATVSFVHYLDNMAENYNEIGNNKESLKKFVGMFTRFEGITMSKMYKEKTEFFRLSSAALNSKPRARDIYNDMYGSGNKTTMENIDLVRDYLSGLDDRFYGRLYRGEIKTDAQVQELVTALRTEYGAGEKIFGTREDPKTVDQLYTVAGDYAAYLLDHKPDAVSEMLGRIRATHAKTFASMKENTMPQLREEQNRLLKNTFVNGNGVIEGGTRPFQDPTSNTGIPAFGSEPRVI